jgi:Transposase DDE domain/Insertion element 4 transposase N-terminal
LTPVKLPSKSAIFQARTRLGFEPLRSLFERVAAPLATPDAVGSWLAGRLLVAIDGTCLDVADTVDNAEFFGRPGVNKGEQAAFPQARVVGLVECGTNAIFDAVTGPYATGEVTLARDLVDRLKPGMVCLADRGFYGFALWDKAQATGADLLWRMRSTQRLDPIEVLADGSYLSRVFEVHNYKRRGDGLVVRVIDYTIDDGRDNDNDYQLITTILDPDVATATDLAVAYSQRWEIESVFDELKTHQRGARTVLRSKSPALVLQEIWGHLCCHYAIRTLMWEAADHAKVDPDRVSFVAALRLRRVPADLQNLPP